MDAFTEADRHKFWSLVRKTDGCWVWTRKLHLGYGQLWVNGKRWIASRLAWVLTNGPITDRRLFVCHHCDNPACVRPDHLFLATQAGNLQDMWKKGRGRGNTKSRGIFNSKTKLTDADVTDMRRRYAAGESYRQLARHYGVWHTTVADVVHRRTWTHLP